MDGWMGEVVEVGGRWVHMKVVYMGGCIDFMKLNVRTGRVSRACCVYALSKSKRNPN